MPIISKIADEDKTKSEILDTLFFTSQATGKNVSLSQIATVETKSSLNQIIRRNSQRTITVGCFIEDGYNSYFIKSAYGFLRNVVVFVFDYDCNSLCFCFYY